MRKMFVCHLPRIEPKGMRKSAVRHPLLCPGSQCRKKYTWDGQCWFGNKKTFFAENQTQIHLDLGYHGMYAGSSFASKLYVELLSHRAWESRHADASGTPSCRACRPHPLLKVLGDNQVMWLSNPVCFLSPNQHHVEEATMWWALFSQNIFSQKTGLLHQSGKTQRRGGHQAHRFQWVVQEWLQATTVSSPWPDLLWKQICHLHAAAPAPHKSAPKLAGSDLNLTPISTWQSSQPAAQITGRHLHGSALSEDRTPPWISQFCLKLRLHTAAGNAHFWARAGYCRIGW